MISEKQIVIQEIQRILLEITVELNDITVQAKKKIQNHVYFLGEHLPLESGIRDSRAFAFIVKKSFWKNKMSIELRSAPTRGKIDDYSLYKTKETLDIFTLESLVVIKHFLLSFMEY